MSHLASVKAYINDIEALTRAADRLGCDTLPATSYANFGPGMHYSAEDLAKLNGHTPESARRSEYKLRRKDHQDGMYEVGVVRRVDGQPGWQLMYDAWGYGGRSIEEKLGRNLNILKTEMNLDIASIEMMRQGYSVERTTNPQTGRPRLHVTGIPD